MLSLCVCPSICLSQVGVLQKWLNIGSVPHNSSGTLGVTPNGGAKCRWGRLKAVTFKFNNFRQIIRYNLKMVQHRCVVSTGIYLVLSFGICWKVDKHELLLIMLLYVQYFRIGPGHKESTPVEDGVWSCPLPSILFGVYYIHTWKFCNI